MNELNENMLIEPVEWIESNEPDYAYWANVEGQRWKIIVNPDFPVEDLYTLVVGDKRLSFNDWPDAWSR